MSVSLIHPCSEQKIYTYRVYSSLCYYIICIYKSKCVCVTVPCIKLVPAISSRERCTTPIMWQNNAIPSLRRKKKKEKKTEEEREGGRKGEEE